MPATLVTPPSLVILRSSFRCVISVARSFAGEMTQNEQEHTVAKGIYWDAVNCLNEFSQARSLDSFAYLSVASRYSGV